MGERRDLKDLLRDTDFAQKRIIDDLASSDAEPGYSDRGVAGDIKKSEGGDFMKNFFIGLLLIGIVVGSFWISFLIGKKVLVPPVKNLPTLEIPAPKAISPLDLEKATPVKEEPLIHEREIKPVAAKTAIAVKKAPAKTAITAPAIKSQTAAVTKKTAAAKKPIKYYKVIVGTFKTAAEAQELANSLKEKGFASFIKSISGIFRVQAGAFDTKEKAVPLVVRLKAEGFSPAIIME